MTVEQLLTTARGRIGRRDYWKALAIVTLMVAISAAAFRLHDGTLCAMDAATVTGKSYFAALGATMLVIGWIGYAYVAKRLHDVNLSGLLALAVVAPYVAAPVVTRLVFCPIAGMPLEGALGELAALTPVLALGGLALLAAMLQLYLGVQRGVVGPNRYGPDPRARAGDSTTDPALAAPPRAAVPPPRAVPAAENALESGPERQ